MSDLTGRRFGNLLALHRERDGFVCVCDCGREVTASEARLLSGEVVTCGEHPMIERGNMPGAYDAPPGSGQPLVTFTPTGKCQMCGETIDRNRYAGTLYCSQACARMALRARLVRRNGAAEHPPREPETRVCELCGRPYLAYSPQSVRCALCRDAAKRASRLEAAKRHAAGAAREIGSVDTCERCGASYVVSNSRQRYCEACGKIAKQESDRRGYLKYKETDKYERKEAARQVGDIPLVRACAVCGKTFDVLAKNALYCSAECRRAAQREQNARNEAQREMRNSDFGAWLRQRRLALGLTQARLAQMCGVSTQAVSMWERGAAKPSGERWDTMCAALGEDAGG